jgi:prevent-host-death family protein
MTMVMFDDSITATKAKAMLLALLDEVQRTGRTITVTKHGQPVADIVPHIHESKLLGSVEFLVDEEELLAPIDLEWDAETG